MDFQSIEGRFDLISTLLAAQPEKNEALEQFQSLLEKDYMEYTKIDDALSEEAGALLELQGIGRDLALFIRNKDVYSKNSIALAGGFSSGKSTFCNNLFCSRDITLPVSINPETAIPAYVISGEKAPNAFGLTASGASVELGVDSYKQMNHEFLKSFVFNLKDLMPSVVIHAEMPKDFEHICFIDTPGYNSAQTDDSYTSKDRETSLMFIRQAKVLFWFIGLDVTGTLTDSDVDFLQEVLRESPDKRIVIVCNKAENRSEDDLNKVLDHIVDILDDNEIPYEGVVAYSSRKKRSYGHRGSKSLDEFFTELNRQNTDKKRELQKRLKDVFRRHINADADRIQESLEKAKSLNKILLHFNSLMTDVESKFSDEAAKNRREAIRTGKKSSAAENLSQESIELIVKEITALKLNLEKDAAKYRENKDMATALSEKMNSVVADVFKDFAETTDDDYVSVPAGSFTMGDDQGVKDVRPAHTVRVNAFKMKATLVTQAEWRNVMGVKPMCKFAGDSLPVDQVYFDEAVAYCNKLSVAEGLEPCYDKKGTCDLSKNGYRLPTEAEWEYAALSFADIPLSECAWYKANANGQTQPVSQKQDNALGLYDMLGNVYEWTNDGWENYSAKNDDNPLVLGDEDHVIRGGCFSSGESSCSVKYRNLASEPGDVLIGFRTVKKV